MSRVFLWLAACALLSGCAAIAPLSSLLTSSTGPPPVQVHEETSVRLSADNFLLVKTNVVGRSRGFSLLGIVTIVPATLTKAIGRLYSAAEMPPGQPQTIAHLVIEQSTSYYVLFGVPEINVRADIVQFKPEVKAPPGPGPLPPAKPPDHSQ